MDLLQTVLNAHDGAAVSELGRTFGLDQLSGWIRAKQPRPSGNCCPPSRPV
jgi:hypothetical protein